MKEKKQLCPKCLTLMKYRGSHLFFCKTCRRLWHLEEGWSVAVKNAKR